MKSVKISMMDMRNYVRSSTWNALNPADHSVVELHHSQTWVMTQETMQPIYRDAQELLKRLPAYSSLEWNSV